MTGKEGRLLPLLLLLLAACAEADGPGLGQPGAQPDQASVELLSRPLPSCAAQADSPGLLQDALADSGVDFVHVESPFPDLGPDWEGDSFRGVFGGGVVAADLDGDGHIDLLLANGGGANGLYWGLGNGQFSRGDAEAAGLALSDEDTAFLAPADFDGDGDLDVLTTGFGSVRLMQNRGDGHFEDVAEGLGIADVPAYPGTAAWGDIDQDGDLDLFVGAYGLPAEGYEGAEPIDSALYENRDGRFVDITADALPYRDGAQGLVLHARFQDLDSDGDLDLMQVNDFGASRGATQLWENVGGSFVDRAAEAGLGELPYPMGGIAQDLDEDGILDLVFSDLGQISVFKGLGPWSFADSGSVWGADLPEQQSDASWSVVDLDLDGSGGPALYLSHGPVEGEPLAHDPDYPFDPAQPDRLLVMGGTAEAPRLQSRPEAFDEPQIGRGRGVAVADLNEDGVPDLVVNNIGGAPGLMLGACTPQARSWIRLEWPGSANPAAIGATVRVEAGGRGTTRTVLAGGPGSGSGQDPILHFGLGESAAIDRIELRWPDGARSEVAGACGRCSLVLRRAD